MLLEDDNPSLGAVVGAGSSAVHKSLDPLSVAELQEYVEALRAEIKRAETEIAKKSNSRAAAESFFKK